MDKDTMFKPTKDEANKLADDYWTGLTKCNEKILNDLSAKIKANAEAGRYKITSEVLRSEKEYIKKKLEDVGYKVEIFDNHTEKRYIYMQISFN